MESLNDGFGVRPEGMEVVDISALLEHLSTRDFAPDHYEFHHSIPSERWAAYEAAYREMYLDEDWGAAEVEMYMLNEAEGELADQFASDWAKFEADAKAAATDRIKGELPSRVILDQHGTIMACQ